MVDERHLEGLGQGELVWFLVWFDPGEVVVEGCEQCGGLFAGEPGCRLVGQRFFPVWFEVISGDLILLFCYWWGCCFLVGLGCGPSYE